MKTTETKSGSKNFESIIAKLSENEILNNQAMSAVKGGSADGEGNGGSVVIIMPK
jgi:hypothetical protein